jgi:hypothetical protein
MFRLFCVQLEACKPRQPGVFRLLDVAEEREYMGYVFCLVIAVAWAIHSKRQRREMAAEIRRLSEQRNQLQQMALDGQIRSSGRRK